MEVGERGGCREWRRGLRGCVSGVSSLQNPWLGKEPLATSGVSSRPPHGHPAATPGHQT